MHYYSHHLGDYAKDTGHLSLAEHGAYRLLLDHYYATETPLSLNLDSLCRICRATARAERQAVTTVLEQFFTKTDTAYTHGRVERELLAKNTLRDRNAENGRRGGRPKQTQEKPTGLFLGSFSETQTKANPIASNQQPTASVLFPKEPKGEVREIAVIYEETANPGKKASRLPTTAHAKRLATLFRRRHTTEWTQVEITAFKRQQPMAEEDIDAIEAYYTAHWPPARENNILRNDLKTLFNNWPGEVDRANAWKASVANRINGTHAAVIPSMPVAPKSFAQIDREDKEAARFGSEPIKMRRAAVWDPDAPAPEPEPTCNQ